MKWEIIQAEMTFNKEDGYVGKVEFKVEGHKQPYEVALHSKRGRDWAYGLFFKNEAGPENEIELVEEELEENDELYDELIEAARAVVVRDQPEAKGSDSEETE
ncbi:hypothetical protein SAMN05444162_4553 [Paenibacillaceae bacterium GAS479]|nr:hypothetical protein SAMN05444162_4553 [Paenibacillaceae bacterium GAS479]